MALSREQIAGLARAVVDGLVRADLLSIRGSHAPAEQAVAKVLERFSRSDEELAREAERLADAELRKLGPRAVGIDRRRIVQMIRQKLASERGGLG